MKIKLPDDYVSLSFYSVFGKQVLLNLFQESAKYLLPWIFTTSVGIIFMFVVSLSYMMYRIDDYILFGLILFLIASKSVIYSLFTESNFLFGFRQHFLRSAGYAF